MSLLEPITFAHVEEDQIAAAALEAVAQLVETHERQPMRRLRDELCDRLAAGAIGAERLAQVLGHRQVETAHELDERSTLGLL